MSKDSELEKSDKIVQNLSIKYLINEEEKTASIIGYTSSLNDLIIPRSIQHNSVEYIITSISERAFIHIKTHRLYFANDSEIKKIHRDAFSYSSIFSLDLPPKLEELEEGWCHGVEKITFINISPDNPYFKVHSIKFLLRKSSIEQKEYDQLVFCTRYCSEVVIPNYIKHIRPYSFAYCKNLKKIEIPKDSNLESIGKYAFYDTSIESITIPAKVFDLQPMWNEGLKKSKIIFSPNNPNFINYQDKFIIGKSSVEQKDHDKIVLDLKKSKIIKFPTFIKQICPNSFNSSLIEEITITSQVEKIGKCAFYYCINLHKVEFAKNSKLEIIDKKAFYYTPIEIVKIPSNVTKIGYGAFYSCEKLRLVEFAKDAKLQLIDDLAFSQSALEKITIPSQVTSIGEDVFCDCQNLVEVIFESNSKLQTIGSNAFSKSKIKSIAIPSNVTKIGERAFYKCKYFNQIDFPSNSKLKEIEKETFFESGIKDITIPSEVTRIGERAFGDSGLHRFEVSSNSKLQTLERSVFYNTPVVSIAFPSKLVDLKDEWYYSIDDLKEVFISPTNPRFKLYDKKLIIGKSSIKQKSYDKLILALRNIKTITIPKFIKQICPEAFYNCNQLQKVEFTNDSNLQIIEKDSFLLSSIEIISIPSKVTYIGKSAFGLCQRLRKIEFTNDSKLQTIEEDSFQESFFDRILIPSQVTQIKSMTFGGCTNLNCVEFAKNSKLQVICEKAFFYSSLKSIVIPSKVEKIEKSAFSKTDDLRIIEIGDNSKLDSIQFKHQIAILMVPTNLKKRFYKK